MNKLLFVTLILGGCALVLGQSQYPLFHHDIVTYASKEQLDLGRIDIFAELVYDDLQFIKVGDQFEAEYEMSAVIMEGRDQIDGKIWQETVRVQSYEKTNSQSDIHLTHASFTVDPGKYVVVLRVEDVHSERTFSIEEKIRVDNYAQPPISGSEIFFARRVDYENEIVKNIVPEVTNPYKGLGSPAYAYFEVYNPNLADSAQISYTISGTRTKEILREDMKVSLAKERSSFTITLPTDSLSHDTYNLAIEIIVNGQKAILEKTFYIRWSGLPQTAEDLDAAVSKLQLLATSKEWKRMKKASDEEKLKAFQEFWKKRDPSPGSEQNEARDAFYAKVGVANQNFTVMGREGWRSDRGIVFIILGPPDEVIRNDYPQGSKPYQIWQYYGINRQFEFYDRDGFGDYQFIYPVSIGELQRYARQL